MSKTPKNNDKLRLLKQEEEASEDQHSKYETNSCGRKCKVLLFYGVLIGMLILLYSLILLGWQSYMKQFGSNETSPVFAIYGIPLYHIDKRPDINEDMPVASRNIYGSINKRKRRSPQTVIGIQSHNDDIDKNKANHLQEEKNLNDDTVSYKDSLQEDSSELEKILQQIITGERMVSKTKHNSYASDQGVEQVIDHQISEDEDKDIIHYKFFNQNKDGITTNTESLISNNHNADDFHYKTAERKYMQNIYENISLGEIYYGIIIVFGILLIIAFCLCIKVFYDFISVQISRKHTRLQEEQENEINKRLDPLNCKFTSTPVKKDLRIGSVKISRKHTRLQENEINKRLDPLNCKFPSTPVEKDLRFTMNREKMDMFCDLYEPT